MSELQRHRMVYKVLMPFILAFLKLGFRYSCDDLSKEEGPYLLLANHNMDLDPLMVGAVTKKQLYFVASEHIMRKGFGTWFLMYFFKPIIHRKGKQGVYTVKEMMKTLKAGRSVCIFPEGNRSFNGLTGDMMPAIGKVARRSGAKLITLRIEGGYLSQPRWSTTFRKGKMRGRVMHRLSAEELNAMTDAQVNELICADLYEDAYATQEREPVAFRGKNLAKGLEAAIFTCPDCGKIGMLHSEDNRFWCECGFSAVYDTYGTLTDAKGNTYTVTQLDAMQREALKKRVEARKEAEAQPGAAEPFFSDCVTLYEIGNDHTVLKTTEGSLVAYLDRLECCGRTIFYKELQGMAVYARNSIVLHVTGAEGQLEIKSAPSFSALKYFYLYKSVTE